MMQCDPAQIEQVAKPMTDYIINFVGFMATVVILCVGLFVLTIKWRLEKIERKLGIDKE